MSNRPRPPDEARQQDAYEKAQQILLAELHEKMTDRPVHREYLDALMASPLDGLERVPVPEGMSDRVADAIQTDVLWVRDTYAPGCFHSAPQRAYAECRRIDARAADRRRRSTRPLESLLRFDNGEE